MNRPDRDVAFETGRRPVRFHAVVEIAPDSSGVLPAALVTAAYCASRFAAVMLVLNGVTTRSIDQVLDPVVRREGVGLRGVVYTSVDDARTVLDAARSAPLVLASTAEFRTELGKRGIVALSPDPSALRAGTTAGTSSGPALPDRSAVAV